MLKQLKDKWQLFREKPQLSVTDLQQIADLEQIAQKMEQEAKAMQALSKTPGWKLFMEYTDQKIEVLRSKLERKEDAVVRADLKAMRTFKSFVLSKLGVAE